MNSRALLGQNDEAVLDNAPNTTNEADSGLEISPSALGGIDGPRGLALELLLRGQKQPGMVDNPLSGVVGRRLPAAVEAFDLANRCGPRRQVGDQPLGVVAIDARHRNQVGRRSVRREATVADGLLHALGQHLHQRQAPRQPARRALHAHCEAVLGQLGLLQQALRQPPLLQRAAPGR